VIARESGWEPAPADPDEDSKAWWAATRENRLCVQICEVCEHRQLYPRSICTRCGADRLLLRDADGRGTVWSFTVTYRPASPLIQVPYVIAIVRLDEGPTVLTQIVGCAPSEVHCDMAVRVDWAPLADGRFLPLFRPRDDK
jgi:uncharacterized OB-fold protein